MNVGPLTAEIRWRVWGTPTNFNGFRVLASLLHRRRSTEVINFAGWLAVSWAETLYIHFWELLPPNGILPGAKFSLRLLCKGRGPHLTQYRLSRGLPRYQVAS